MPRAIVAGAGIAGLASAIALERAGWSVSDNERASEIRPLGAALSLWPNATSALDRLGLLDRVAAVGFPLRAMFVADQAGKPIMAARQMTDPALMITRAALQDCLAGAVLQSPILLDDAISSTEQTASHVEVRFADGRMACEYWGRHQRFGLFEITGSRRYWFFMNTQDADAQPPTHATVLHHAKHWPLGIAEAVEATPAERLIPFSIFAKPPPKKLGFGRIICVGDAAHAMEPNLGQGACQALEDAAALAVVAKNVAPEAMLAAFETLRLKRVRTIVARAAEARGGAHGSPFLQTAMRMMLRTLPAKLVDGVSRDVQTMPDYRA